MERLYLSPSPGPKGEALYSIGIKGYAEAGGVGGGEEALGWGEMSLQEVVGE